MNATHPALVRPSNDVVDNARQCECNYRTPLSFESFVVVRRPALQSASALRLSSLEAPRCCQVWRPLLRELTSPHLTSLGYWFPLLFSFSFLSTVLLSCYFQISHSAYRTSFHQTPSTELGASATRIDPGAFKLFLAMLCLDIISFCTSFREIVRFKSLLDLCAFFSFR